MVHILLNVYLLLQDLIFIDYIEFLETNIFSKKNNISQNIKGNRNQLNLNLNLIRGNAFLQ